MKEEIVKPQTLAEYLKCNEGLSPAEVQARKAAGLYNKTVDFTERKVSHIIAKNLFSFFNLLNFAIAAGLFYVGSYKNTMFLGVAVFNTITGIVQEVRAKNKLKSLSLANSQLETVLRGGQLVCIPSQELVQDDIVILKPGCGVSADCVVLQGQVEVSIAILTGESEYITKKVGDTLLSGSFVAADTCCAKVLKVSEASYINQLAKSAGKYKKYSSEMIDDVDLFVKRIALFAIPLCAVLFWRQYSLGGNLTLSLEQASAAMISMIPQGLVLLISIALTASALKLANQNILVQELFGLESLAKAGAVCLDKTGTLTQNKLKVTSIAICSPEYTEPQLREILADILENLNDTTNKTFCAIKEYVSRHGVSFTGQKASAVFPFSSARKWSGVEFGDEESFILGASEVVLAKDYAKLKPQIEAAIADGNRVLALAFSPQKLSELDFSAGVCPVALLVLSDLIRKDASSVISLLQKRGTKVKIVSGDNPLTVSLIAKKVGLKGYKNYIDATTLKDDDALREAAEKYTILGRVSPNQKESLVKILKKDQQVAMVGDGINDILAIKASDCGIALGSGSSAARQVAQIVLLDDNFGSVPSIIFEGQRIINNMQRSGALFLSKALFSVLLCAILVLCGQKYPLQPLQLTLINCFTVGIPSFFLSFEPDRRPATGRFLTNILAKALPAAITMLVAVVGANLIAHFAALTHAETATLCAFIIAFVNLTLLWQVSAPLTKLRKALLVLVTCGFCLSSVVFKNFFGFEYSKLLLLASGLLLPATGFLFRFCQKVCLKLFKN